MTITQAKKLLKHVGKDKHGISLYSGFVDGKEYIMPLSTWVQVNMSHLRYNPKEKHLPSHEIFAMHHD